MNLSIMNDYSEEPQLFFWFGGASRDDLDDWMAQRGLSLPDDLVDLWHELGGGDLFETETILSPFGNPVLGDDVQGVTDLHLKQGLPPEYLLFHKGLYLSAVRLTDGKYVALSDSYVPFKEYSSLEDWYSDLRSEYKVTYGLR